MKEIQLDTWKEFKDICIKKKKLNVQVTSLGKEGDLHVFAIEGPLFWFVDLVLEEDIKEFDTKYRSKANGRIEP